MKSSIFGFPVNPARYPAIYTNTDTGSVVLATGPHTGVVVHKGPCGKKPVGYDYGSNPEHASEWAWHEHMNTWQRIEEVRIELKD